MYKSRTEEKCSLDKGKVNSEKTQKKVLLVNLGGMLYDKELQRGVRKKCLPEPNPTKVELDRCSTLSSIFQFAKNLYFKDMEGEMMLGDSYGTAIHVSEQTVASEKEEIVDDEKDTQSQPPNKMGKSVQLKSVWSVGGTSVPMCQILYVNYQMEIMLHMQTHNYFFLYVIPISMDHL